MAKVYDSYELLAQLDIEVETVTSAVQQVSTLGERLLNTPPEPGKWSIAQVIEHLNTYNRYYLPLARIAINKAHGVSGSTPYKPGWLGEYFTRSMYSEVVTARKVSNKMKALKGHRPQAVLNAGHVIMEFVKDQQVLQQLIEDLHYVDMASEKIHVTISPLIKIQLGDAIRFLVAHQVRHLLQINNTLAVVNR